MKERNRDKIQIEGDYQHKAYFSGFPSQRKWHQYKYDEAIAALQLKSGDKVMDVGCGSGVTSDLIAGIPGVEVRGFDSNPEAIEFCKKQYKKSNLDFELMTFGELTKLGHGVADKILFLETIEHITTEQAKDIVSTFAHLLNRGGLVTVSTPNRKSLWPMQEWILDAFKLVPSLKEGQHEHLYSGKELEKLFTASAFKVVEKKSINFLAPWAAIMSSKLADSIHRWERSKSWIPGSLLLYTFQKI